MIKEITLPEVSENIDKGEVIKILVKEGDKIEVDQPLVELETDKAMFEVPSTEAGVVKEIKVKEGGSLDVGGVILTVETEGKEGGDEKEKPGKETGKKAEVSEKEKKKSEEESKDKESKKEKSGKEQDEAEERGEDGDEEKDKKAGEEEKEQDKGEKKDEADAGDSERTKVKEDKEQEDTPDSGKEKNQKKIPAPASPSVRRLARELGVEIDNVQGSGSSGRISEEDVKKHVKDLMEGSAPGTGAAAQKALPDFSKWGDVEVAKMSKVRQITAETLSYAWTTIPHVTHFDRADITLMESFRKKYGKKIESEGGQLTITSILVKIAAAALKQFPQFNSSIDINKKEIIYKKYFNIGIAVDTDRGLLVPVIKNVEKKSLTKLSKELTELAEKARNKKIVPGEMEGGTFTITNLGGIGGTNFTPIVYTPQVAILAVSRANMEAVYTDGEFKPRLMAPLALSYDHRIIDGADAARFLRWICEALENPFLIQL